jgi:hypothetical protein
MASLLQFTRLYDDLILSVCLFAEPHYVLPLSKSMTG